MPNRLRLLVFGAIGVLVVVVAVSASSCTPNSVTVTTGTPDFAIHNTSDRAIEWEILDGVMVLAERENIAPGFTVEVTPRLPPGSYQMTCGLLSNPHGTLTVAASAGPAGPPQLADLVAPTAEFRVYAIHSADDLILATAALNDAVKTGDLAAARLRAADATRSFAHLAAIAHLFDRDAGPLAAGPTALGVLSTALAAATAPAGMTQAAAGAARTAASLGGAIHASTAAPHEIVAGAGSVVARLAQDGITDPATATARIEGVRKVVDLFQPLTQRSDKALAAKLESDLGGVESGLARLAGTTADTAGAATLKTQLADLGSDLTDLLAALGLNAT
jgi:iron uptake system component EfeO